MLFLSLDWKLCSAVTSDEDVCLAKQVSAHRGASPSIVVTVMLRIFISFVHMDDVIIVADADQFLVGIFYSFLLAPTGALVFILV